MIDEIKNAEDLNEFLSEDVDAALANCKQNDSQFNRRTLVRTLFANLEAMIFSLKQTIVNLLPHRLSPADFAMLSEQTYRISDKGEVETQSQFIPFRHNFRYAVKTFASVFDVQIELDCGGQEWAALRSALVVRNRITHPKTAQDCDVSTANVDDVLLGHKWAYCVITSCYLKYIEKLAGDKEEHKTEIAKLKQTQAIHEADIARIKKRIKQAMGSS